MNRRGAAEFYAVWGIGMLCILLTAWASHEHQASDALRERLRVQDSVVTAATHHVDSVHVVLRQDTVTLHATQTVYRDRRDSVLLALHDTTRIRDTVTVQQFIRMSDSTISTCNKALRDCTALSAAQDTQLVAVRRRDALRLELAKPPRIQLAADLLYDPFRATPAVRAEATLHLFRRTNFTTQALFPAGESPRTYVGVRWTF